eukprot:EG_transcript_8296
MAAVAMARPGRPPGRARCGVPVLPGLVGASVLVVAACIGVSIAVTGRDDPVDARDAGAANRTMQQLRKVEVPEEEMANPNTSAGLVLSIAAPSAERQLGEQANELFGTQEVRWPHSRRFQVVFWDERAQEINLGSTRNFILWLNQTHSDKVDASLVRCHSSADCSHHFLNADVVGIVGSIADRNKAELGVNRMAYVRGHASLKSKLSVLSLTGDEYCQLKSHQNVDLVFRNYWDAPYMKAFGAHLPGGHAAWMPMGKGHAMPAVEPRELEERPGRARKYVFNFVVSLNTHRDRKALQAIVARMSTQNSTPRLPWFVHYTKHWSPNYDPSHKYLPPADWKRVLLDSLYTLVPSGKNLECFRMWEALEAGSIPIVVNRVQPSCGDSWVPFGEPGSQVVFLNDWEELPSFVEGVLASEEALAKAQGLQNALVTWYHGFKLRHYTKLLNLLIRAHMAKTYGEDSRLSSRLSG